MNPRLVASCCLVSAVLAVTGCEDGRKNPPDASVVVANVAPGFQELGFRREQTSARSLAFRDAQINSWDVDTYDFFIDERGLFVGDTPRFWTFRQELVVDTDYTFVLTEVAGEVQPVVIANPEPTATAAQIAALHAAPGLPAMDLYLEGPGVGIAGATPRGTFNVQGQIAAQTLPGGEYELWLTEAGNPANVLLASATITLATATTSTFVVVPETGSGTTRLSVLMLQDGSAVIYDRNVTSELRVINAATDTVPRDVAINSVFSPPLFSAAPFAEPTAYAPVALGTQTLNVTPVGNPGVLELEMQIAPTPAQRITVMFTGPAGALLYAAIADDGRRIQGEAKVNFMNAATQFLAVDFVLTATGADPTNIPPVTVLGVPGSPFAYSYFPPGTYDLYLRESTTGALLSGPTAITVDGGGIYGVLATNGPDTATATVTLYDDFP
jgi:hypothetical protein